MPSPIPAAALTAAAHAIESQSAGSSAAHLARVALEAAVPVIRAADEHPIAADEHPIAAYQDLPSSIWLYIDWRYVTRQLTAEQRELFADAVDAEGRRVAEQEGPAWGAPTRVDRWWRDGEPREDETDA